MSNHNPVYGTEGPLGFPMQDRQAFALESILKALPREEAYRYRKAVVAKGPSETLTGERSDVSWISTEDPDRQGEVVIARGLNDSQFQLNPIVTMQHAYWMPPVGKSLWRKRVKDGALVGIKAKTQYHQRPDAWPADCDWPPDVAFTLVQNGLLCGKSVGFLPTKARRPTEEEIDKWFSRNSAGPAIVGGAVSGNLAILDIEFPDFAQHWRELVDSEAPGLLEELPHIETPGKTDKPEKEDRQDEESDLKTPDWLKK